MYSVTCTMTKHKCIIFNINSFIETGRVRENFTIRNKLGKC